MTESANQITVRIDRIAIRGTSLTPAAANRIGERVEQELARALRDGSWPEQSRRTETLTVALSRSRGGEGSVVDSIVDAVMQGLGATGTRGSARE